LLGNDIMGAVESEGRIWQRLELEREATRAEVPKR
jgi:hypothetical protein